MSDSGDRRSTIFKLNVYNGRLKKIIKAPVSYAHYITNSKGEVVLATGIDKQFRQQVFIRSGDDWQQMAQSEFGSSFTPVTVSHSGKNLYVLDNYKQDKVGLFKFNLESRKYKKVYTDQKVDITNISRTVDNRNIYAIRLDDGLPEYLLINKKLEEAKVFKLMAQGFPGSKIDIRSHTEDGIKYIVSISSDTDPGGFYLYNVKSNQLGLIFKRRPNIEPSSLTPMEAFNFEASDGNLISGYFSSANTNENKIAPLVLLVHGGPHARDYWGFSSQVQYLTKSGFSVLQVNFRGSTGYGRGFEFKGYKNWGSRIQQDIYESLLWAVKNKKAELGNACIMGASFGGYSALQSIINYSDTYQCAVANAGVYDLPLLFTDGDVKKLGFGKSYLKLTLGKDKEQLNKYSPVNHVERIKVPLMLAHGKEDERAPYEHAENLREALDNANKPYQWFVLEDETHGFFDPANQKEYMRNVVAFLNKHLKTS